MSITRTYAPIPIKRMFMQPPNQPPPRPKDPERPARVPVTRPPDIRTLVRPKPLGLVLPIPLAPPTRAALEVGGRAAGRYAGGRMAGGPDERGSDTPCPPRTTTTVGYGR